MLFGYWMRPPRNTPRTQRPRHVQIPGANRCVRIASQSNFFRTFQQSDSLTEKGAKCYNAPVLRDLIWSTSYLFHRVIHRICGIRRPPRQIADVLSQPDQRGMWDCAIFPSSARRGGRTIKKKFPFRYGAAGVVSSAKTWARRSDHPEGVNELAGATIPLLS